jgi:p-aminobenzoyl-glutamate transporter AbgT
MKAARAPKADALNTAGPGTIALTLPYCLAILIAWTALLQLWIWLDIPLGPAGPLHYPNR